MKRNEIAPKIEAYLTERGPASVSEIVGAVGCSRQSVYQWVTKNRGRLRAVGITEHGATQYELVSNAVGANHAGALVGAITLPDLGGEHGGVQVGDTVVVRAMRWQQGRLVIGLEAGDGTELVATVV